MSVPSQNLWHDDVDPTPGRDDLSGRRLLRSAALHGVLGPAPAVALPRRGDWDLIFAAVTDRLRRAAAAPGEVALARVVLECAEALDRLHAALERDPG